MGSRSSKYRSSSSTTTTNDVPESQKKYFTEDENIHKKNNMEKIDFKSRLERKMCLAKETPEPEFDLSECNLKEIPSGVFIHCRILLKETLNISNNQLTAINTNNNNNSSNSGGGGQLSDLSLIKILNLNYNKIIKLPEEIFRLENLRELLISNNCLIKLPQTINSLKYLELLDLSNNKLKSIDEIKFMSNLRILNIQGNQCINHIPKTLATCESLYDLIFDNHKIEWPSPEICANGTRTILRFLLTNEFTMDTIDSTKSAQQSVYTLHNKEDALIKELQHNLHNNINEQKRSNNYINFSESEYGNEDALLQELQVKQQIQKQNLLQAVLLQQNETETLVNKLQQQKDIERLKLIKDILHAEENAILVIDKFLALKCSSDLELLEKERLEEEKLLEMVHLEHADLRKQEILATMMETLNDEENKLLIYQQKRNHTSHDILEREHETSLQLNQFYRNYERNRNEVIEKICNNEELQKQAVITLIAKNDARTWGLVEQLKIIEIQLCGMTQLELEKKKFSNVEQMNDLADKRIRLTCILMDLLEQQEKRKRELFDTLTEIEAQKSTEQQDFWLLQYQKLLDCQPLEFSTKTNTIDPLLGYNFLVNGVIHCLPFLQKLWQNSNVCLDKLQDNDFEKAGIRDKRDRRLILKSIDDFLKQTNNSSHVRISTSKNYPEASSPQKPSSNSLDTNNIPSTSAFTTPAVAAAAAESNKVRETIDSASECVICMEESVKVIFLPCGHMCCCLQCQLKVELCPMCRASIERKIKVVQP